jgi:hypothetical protein
MPILTPEAALEQFNAIAQTIEEKSWKSMKNDEALLLITEGGLANTLNQSVLALIQSGVSEAVLDAAQERVKKILDIVVDVLFEETDDSAVIEEDPTDIKEISEDEINKQHDSREAAVNEILSHFTIASDFQRLRRIQEQESEQGYSNIYQYHNSWIDYSTQKERTELNTVYSHWKSCISINSDNKAIISDQGRAVQAEFNREYQTITAHCQARQNELEPSLTEDRMIWRELITLQPKTKENSPKRTLVNAAIKYLENPTDKKAQADYITARESLKRLSGGMLSSRQGTSKTDELKGLYERIDQNETSRKSKNLSSHSEEAYHTKRAQLPKDESKRMEEEKRQEELAQRQAREAQTRQEQEALAREKLEAQQQQKEEYKPPSGSMRKE